MYSKEIENRLDSPKVKATKKLLKETLVELLREKKLEQITVVEITDKAHLNRTTFYRHYLDVYDLYEQIVDEYAQVGESIFPVYFRKIWRGEFTGLHDELVVYWEEHKEQLKVLLLQDHQLIERIKQGNMAYVREYLQIPDDDKEINLIMEFYMTGTLGIILKCLRDETPADEMREVMTLQYEIVTSSLLESLNKRVKE